MKKSNLFLMLLTALIVMSCSKDETTMSIPQEGNAIEFGTYVGRDAQTRASVLDIDGLKGTAANTYTDGKGFGVYAYYTGQSDWAAWSDANSTTAANFMFNQAVKWDGTIWKYSPVKYWPNNKVGAANHERVSFFAYAPYNFGGSAPTLSGSILDFAVKNTVTEQIDLLWNSTKATDLSKQDVEGKVAFNFKHALSRIGINVRAVVDEVTAGTNAIDENTTITVDKVVLCKSATIVYDGETSVFEGAFYETGKLNLNIYDTDVAIAGSAAWIDKSGTQSFTLLPVNFTNDAVTLTKDNSNEFQELNKTDSYVMIIPQDFGTNAFTVYIEYTVTTTDSGNTANSSTITNKIATPVEINFLSGTAYALNLQLGMTSVKLEATVTDWADEADTVVNVPINTAP